MFARKTTALALGTLLALAVTLSGSVAPAFAAVAPSVPARDRMEHLGEVFHPDVRVKYLGPAYDNGKYQYRFRVENLGAASADNVFVDQEVRQLTYDGSIGKIQYLGGKNIPTLASGQSVEVKVSCIPLPGYVCTGASATANVPDDLDPTNNDAQST
jgi:hypothetical protein